MSRGTINTIHWRKWKRAMKAYRRLNRERNKMFLYRRNDDRDASESSRVRNYFQ